MLNGGARNSLGLRAQLAFQIAYKKKNKVGHIFAMQT
jgi:hypothetical protein